MKEAIEKSIKNSKKNIKYSIDNDIRKTIEIIAFSKKAAS